MTDVAGRRGGEPAAADVSKSPAASSLFAAAVFASAALVFMVEPMVTKLVLPLLGGSPAVWNTSLAFFQAALLVGYGYAHLLQRIGSLRRQAVIHGAVLVGAAVVLPLHVSHVFGDPTAAPPALWLLGVLLVSIGAPFAALSATAPLVQAWYARTRPTNPAAENPYVLYAASNLGSLLALLAYPIIVEPALRLRTQTLAWSVGYGAFVALMAAVAWVTRGAGARTAATPGAGHAAAGRSSWRERLTWIVLAALPSSLMLGVTTHISTDIASAPFLWVAPLALYLLTFIIAFQARPLIPPPVALVFQAAAVLACFTTFSLSLTIFVLQVFLHLAGFFLTALICHQALAARRPSPERLTEFYLLMSLGGVLGGAFNAFLAPVIFNTVLEYPLVLALTCLVRPWGRGGLSRRETVLFLAGLLGAGGALIMRAPGGPTPTVKLLMGVIVVTGFLLRDRAWIYLALCLVLAFVCQVVAPQSDVLKNERGFFGVLRLTEITTPELGRVRFLAHGTTLHGAQAQDPAVQCRPLVYYAGDTPIGQVFDSVQARKPAIRIGAVGMGTGTIATYVRPGDSLRFFEIDPQVIGLATDPTWFRYIKGCARGRVDWILGDARLQLARQPPDAYDVLLVDAFSSDAVPAHLLTVEAMRVYLSRIKPDGVVIMHLSSRNLELMKPVAGVARAAGGAALQQYYVSSHPSLLSDPTENAVIVARNAEALAPFRADPRWAPAQFHGVRVWTDDYTDLFGAVARRVQQIWTGAVPAR